MTPAQRAMRAKLGAHTSWAKTENRTERTAPGRAAADARFERDVRAEFPNLPDEEVYKLAANARAAHYLRMQLNSAASRAKKAGKA